MPLTGFSALFSCRLPVVVLLLLPRPVTPINVGQPTVVVRLSASCLIDFHKRQLDLVGRQ
jgi:hypothetical protein